MPRSAENKLYFTWALVIVAFAFNSILCRWALAEQSIDPLSFTLIRLAFGALSLGWLVIILGKKNPEATGLRLELNQLCGRGPVYLLVYAVLFSLAYVQLETGAGALLLFGAVQFTILAAHLIKGAKLSTLEWLGSGLALTGLVYLTLPSFGTPSLLAVILMLVAGFAWGMYTVSGSAKGNAATTTFQNFVFASVLMLLVYFALGVVGWSLHEFNVETASIGLADSSYLLSYTPAFTFEGILLAAVSGAICSGLGYALWYQILPSLTGSSAATSQLTVPVISGLGGWLFVGEVLTTQFWVASLLILGGMLLVLFGQRTR